MKNFENPEIQVTSFNAEDVITASSYEDDYIATPWG